MKIKKQGDRPASVRVSPIHFSLIITARLSCPQGSPSLFSGRHKENSPHRSLLPMEDRSFPTGSKSAPAAARAPWSYTRITNPWRGRPASAPQVRAPLAWEMLWEVGAGGRREEAPPPPPPDRKRMKPKDFELWSPLSSGHASPFLVQGAAWEDLLERVR